MNTLALLVRYSLGSLFLGIFRLLRSKVRSRLAWERSSLKELGDFRLAKTWYHCSSEGEFEQIWPLVKRFIDSNDEKQLIWYTSPSLKKKAAQINSQYDKVRMLPFPLLSLVPGSSHPLRLEPPKQFFMVRYDFFPELVFIGARSERFILLGASFKGKERALKRNYLKFLYTKSLYSKFSEIYFSTDTDLSLYKVLFSPDSSQLIYFHDFRHGQIINRQRQGFALAETHCREDFLSLLEKYDFSERIILGSAWPIELGAFDDSFLEDIRQRNIFVFVAPHKLSGDGWEFFESWLKGLKDLEIEACLWDEVGIHGRGNVILCKTPGLLCELYSYFGHSFIGGGFGRSVHSLLEPYWGGGHIYCGPKVGRSTEYDYVNECSPAHIHVVDSAEAFYNVYKDKKSYALDRGARQELSLDLDRKQEDFLNSFFSSSEKEIS